MNYGQQSKVEYAFSMRTLLHPPADAITVEGILHALSDPDRAAIFGQIARSSCAQTCSDFMRLAERRIPKSTLSQHFKVLREAGLIRSERRGVEMHNTSRCQEVDRKFPNLLPSIAQAFAAQAPVPERSRRRQSGR
jgi:DNA-binding transcriptional ArsR family regulator